MVAISYTAISQSASSKYKHNGNCFPAPKFFYENLSHREPFFEVALCVGGQWLGAFPLNCKVLNEKFREKFESPEVLMFTPGRVRDAIQMLILRWRSMA